MFRVVLDTNVLLSALIKEGKPRILLRRACEGIFTLLLSREILNEFLEVSGRKYFQEHVVYQQIARFLRVLTSLAEFTLIKSDFKVIKEDPADDLILRTAYDSRTDFIVSGDKHLLALKEFKGIKIVTVSGMLKLLNNL